jgi:hypothetical protein
MRSGILVTALLVSLSAIPAQASIIAYYGDIVQVSPPWSVQEGDYENNTEIRLFAEHSPFFLPQRIRVDITTPGLYDDELDLDPSSFVRKNMYVMTYLLHADPVRPGDDGREYQGRVRFGSQILGVIVLRGRLRNTDALLGAAGTLYPASGDPSTGLELNPDQDWVELINPRTLRVHFRTHGQIDEVRVLVEAPEPGTLLLLGVALIGLGVALRRRVR